MTFKGKCCKHFCRRLCVVFALIILFPLSVQSAESPKEKIAFAYAAISPSMAGVWMAKESGAFDRNGLSVDLVYISSGAVAIQALVGGSVQAALGASNAVLAATIKGAPIIAVGSNTSRPGMQLWVQPEIQRPEQLQGKTLAITRFGSTSEFVTRLILRKLNLEGKTELRQFGVVVEADLGFRARQAEGRVSSQAPGDFAQAYVIAHEVGHHVQNLLGIMTKVQSLQSRAANRNEANALSVRLELQADCLAGIWASYANRERNILEQGDVEEGLNAAAQIGDDRIQKRAQGYVVPEGFTHGSAEQRVQWFRRGIETADLKQCDTFSRRSVS